MTEITNSEHANFQDAHRNNSDSECRHHFLMREAVDEQIMIYIALLVEQLDDLFRLIKRMTQAHPSTLPIMASTSARFPAGVSDMLPIVSFLVLYFVFD